MAMASKIAGLVVERGIDNLVAPVKRVTFLHMPVPARLCLEADDVPSLERVMAALEETLPR